MPMVKLKGPLGVTFRMLHDSCSPNLPSYFQMSHLMPPKQSLPHCPSVWAPFKIWLTPQLLTAVFQINFSNSVKCSSLWPVPKKPNSSGLLWAPLGNKCWITLENQGKQLLWDKRAVLRALIQRRKTSSPSRLWLWLRACTELEWTCDVVPHWANKATLIKLACFLFLPQTSVTCPQCCPALSSIKVGLVKYTFYTLNYQKNSPGCLNTALISKVRLVCSRNVVNTGNLLSQRYVRSSLNISLSTHGILYLKWARKHQHRPSSAGFN